MACSICATRLRYWVRRRLRTRSRTTSGSSSHSQTGSRTPTGKAELRSALEASGAAMEKLLRKAMAAGGKVKGFKPHAVAFLGYLISHESHHRGQIGWTLKGTGHPLDQKTAYGLWEWGVR